MGDQPFQVEPMPDPPVPSPQYDFTSGQPIQGNPTVIRVGQESVVDGALKVWNGRRWVNRERVEGEVPDWFLEALMKNMPNCWDADMSAEALVIEYVRALESKVTGGWLHRYDDCTCG